MPARDEAHVDGLIRKVPTSCTDIAGLQKHKYGLRYPAEAALEPLAAGTVHLTREVARARFLARHAVWRKRQQVKAAIDEQIARGASVLVRDLTELARQQTPRLAPTPPLGAVGTAASPPDAQGGETPPGASQTFAPPVSATDEVRLLHDLGHELLLVDLLRVGGQHLS